MAPKPRRAGNRAGATEKAGAGVVNRAIQGHARKQRSKRGDDEPVAGGAPSPPSRRNRRREGQKPATRKGRSNNPKRTDSRNGQGIPSSFPVSIVGVDQSIGDSIFAALMSRFLPLQLNLVREPSEADLVISFGASEVNTAERRKNIVVVVNTGDLPNRGGSALAEKSATTFRLSLELLSRRYGKERLLQENGALTSQGCDAVADCIRQRLVAAYAGIALTPSLASAPADLGAALALSDSPAELLAALEWPAKSPPQLWRIALDVRTIQALLGGKILIAGKGRPQMLSLPVDWEAGLPDAAANAALYSLDFLAGSLNYWLQKANRASSPAISQIDKAVKKKNVTASALLGSAGDTLLDFLRHETALPDAAWHVPAVQRRACIFSLYLLCCRMAAARRIKFDEAGCAPIFRALLESLERLRPSAEWPVGTSEGVKNAAILASLALSLRKLRYGAVLLDECLTALRERQLALGMSPDGLWWEGMSQQGEVLGTLGVLSKDLRQVGLEAPRMQATMEALATCATALVYEGMCPPINEWVPARQRATLLAVRNVRKGNRGGSRGKPAASGQAEAPAPGAAILLPDAGFFVSRTARSEENAGSQLVLQARPPSKGGISLSFSAAKKHLLIGGGAAEGRVPAAVRRATRLSPAAHNAVRVNRQNHSKIHADFSVQIERTWEQETWAAARLSNNIFETTQIYRTAIHLKPHAALLVVDECISGQSAKFEQFWHFSPELEPPDEDTYRSLSSGEDVLNVSFFPGTSVALKKGDDNGIGWTSSGRRTIPNWYAAQHAEGERLLMLAFFRLSSMKTEHALRADLHPDGWNLRVSGDDLDFRFEFRDEQLTGNGQS